MGFFIRGYFIGLERREFKKEDGSVDVKYSVNVATGSLAYRVYMSDEFDPSELAELRPGAEIVISMRVYVSKAGKLSCVDGKVDACA